MWKQVKSSNIDQIDYDAAHQALLVRFKSGKVYRYNGVSDYTYEELLNSESKGKYLCAYIKPAYAVEKMED